MESLKTAAVLAAALLAAAPVLAVFPESSAAAADKAPGKLTSSRTTVAAGGLASYSLTLAAPKARIRGRMRVVIPGGWSPPQNRKRTGPGFVKVERGRCQVAKLTKIELLAGGARRLVLDIDCGKGKQARISYQRVTAPKTAGVSRWPTTAKFNRWGQFVPFDFQPEVSVTAAAPAALAPSRAPLSGAARTQLDPVVFEVRDRYGNRARTPVTVTAHLSSCPDAILSGTKTVTSSDGLVQFNNLEVSRACTGAVLSASSSGLNGARTPAIRVSGAWQRVATAPTPINEAAVLELDDGRILIVADANTSAIGPEPTSRSYLYEPSTGTFTQLSDAPTARLSPTAVQLRDGRVIVFGGRTTSSVSTPASTEVDAWDPETGEWTSLGRRTLASPDSYYDQAAVLPDGRVLVLPFDDWDTTPMLYDPTADTWSLTGQLHHPNRNVFSWAPLSDGRVMVYGGTTSPEGFIGFGEIYDPDTGEWREVAPTTDTRRGAAVAVLDDGRVMFLGGYTHIGNSNPPLRTTVIYDVATDSWTPGPPLAMARIMGRTASRTDGQIMLAGGTVEYQYSQPDLRRSAESGSTVTGSWRSESYMSEDRSNSGVWMFALADNTVIVLGGSTVEQFS
jgi:hypothetical protein